MNPKDEKVTFRQELGDCLRLFEGREVSPDLLIAIKGTVLRLLNKHVSKDLKPLDIKVTEMPGYFMIGSDDDYTLDILRVAYGYKVLPKEGTDAEKEKGPEDHRDR